MKRIFAIMLVTVMCLSTLLLSACSDSNNPSTTQSASTTEVQSTTKTPSGAQTTETASSTKTPTTETPVITTTESPNETIVDLSDEIFNSIKRSSEKKEHATLEELPASFTLVGTDYLPAVYQRGTEIVNEAADAVTYMQYTNAVARYVHSIDPTSTWKPATDKNSCYSAKFTGQFAKSLWGNYDVLRDNGCLTYAEDDFSRSGLGLPIIKKSGNYATQTTRWLVNEGLGDKALEYRLIQYTAINPGDTSNPIEAGGYYNTHTKGIEITYDNETGGGKDLLIKIKDAIATGNVVVGQGIYEGWQMAELPGNTSTGKAGDAVIAYSLTIPSTDTSTSYQLCLVGYDDNLSYETNGVTTKGAFLVCNAGDANWGKNGYAWLMYDSLNTFCAVKKADGSEAFELDKELTRDATLNYFTFVYWDTDITNEKPTLYAEIEVEAANRYGFTFYMTKTDAFGRTSSIEAYQTYHVRIRNHEYYDLLGENTKKEDVKDYFNFGGDLNGKSSKGYFTVSFERLLTNLPEDTTYDQFTLGLRIAATSNYDGSSVTVKSIKFKNSAGEVIKTVNLPNKETATSDSGALNFRLDFGKEVAKDIIVGNFYTFKNVATGQYILKDKSMPTMSLGNYNEKNICWFHITYTAEKNLYKFYWKQASSTYTQPMDITPGKVPTDGAQVYINPMEANSREATQFWNVSYNEDGTFCIYLKNSKNELFALASGDKVVKLKQITEVTDDIKWTMETDYDASYASTFKATVEKTDTGLHVEAKNVTSTVGTIETVTVKVYNFSKKELASADATVENKIFALDIAVDSLPEEYFVQVTATVTDKNGQEVLIYPVNGYILFN